ncbi:MAG TPA: glycosyltransferase family A protein, partial [Propionibacteriaceae bacterium]|nr:glycosyltransferase family A protein [Propionibacteriaceae bacterium]
MVDNGSTDGTANRARRLGVRVVEERTPGVCAARQRDTLRPQRNRGVHRCRHRAPQDWLTRLDARLTADPTIVAVA